MFLRRLGLVALLGAAGCVGVDDESAVHRGARAPEASLRAPVIAPVGGVITFDASASSPRGEPRAYVFEFSDGSDPVRTLEPTAQHAFAHEGLYSVRVHILDVSGLEGIAVQDVAVRTDFPARPDFCRRASDCIVGDDCDGGVCYSTGGALQ